MRVAVSMKGAELAPASSGVAGLVAAAWGIGGAAALLVSAIARLGPVALEAPRGRELTLGHWAFAAAWAACMAWFEGYKGFQRGFAPRVVARALHLSRAPRPLHALLAPLYCMGLVHASPRRLATSWGVTLAVVALVAAVRSVGQPWRGLIDAGVVVGLGWGLFALVAFAVRAAAGAPPQVALDLPAPRGGLPN